MQQFQIRLVLSICGFPTIRALNIDTALIARAPTAKTPMFWKPPAIYILAHMLRLFGEFRMLPFAAEVLICTQIAMCPGAGLEVEFLCLLILAVSCFALVAGFTRNLAPVGPGLPVELLRC